MSGGDRRHLPPAAPQTRCPNPLSAGRVPGSVMPGEEPGRWNCWTGVCRMVSGRCGVWDWEEALWACSSWGSDHGRCTGVVEYPRGGTGVSDRGGGTWVSGGGS